MRSLWHSGGNWLRPEALAIALALALLVLMLAAADASAGSVSSLSFAGSITQSGEPNAVAVDREGNIWVADSAEDRVAEFNSQHAYLRQVGEEGPGEGQFNGIGGIATDESGDLYVTDSGNNRVQEFSPSGEHLRTFGSSFYPFGQEYPGTAGFSIYRFGQLASPGAITVDPNGDVWVLNTYGSREGGRIVEFSPSGRPLSRFGSSGTGEGQLGWAFGLSYSGGNLYVAELNNGRVQEFSTSGKYEGQFDEQGSGNSGSDLPYGIATDPNTGNQYVTELGGDRVREFSPDGGYLSSFGSSGSGNGQFSRPEGVAVNSTGDVYVADAANDRVQEWIPALAPSNAAPPTISGAAEEEQTLTASSGSWEGTAPLTYAYQWQRCDTLGEGCAAIAGATSPAYVPLQSDAGSTLRILVTASNLAGSASEASASSAVVIPHPPSNITLATISGTAEIGQTLSTHIGTWTGTPPLTFAYHWQSCDSLSEACVDIPGATAPSYALGASDLGTTVRVVVTATNAGGSASSTSASTAPVAAAIAPSNTTLATISGTAQVGQMLVANVGTWEGTQPIAYAFEWQRCSSEGCRFIPGVTTASYTPASGDAGTRLRVLVTATNAGGTATSISALTAPVTAAAPVTPPPSPPSATAPSNTTPPAVSGTAQAGQTLQASTGTWAGTQPISFSYQWQGCNSLGVSCLSISGATSTSYALGASDVGTTVRVLVTATNAGGSATSTSASTAVVLAPAPVMIAPSNTTPPAISGTAQSGETLRASTGVWVGTAPISYTYQWQRCSGSGAGCAAVAGASGSTYAVGQGDVGSTLRVLVTATNSAGSASSASALTTAVTAPTPPTPPPTPPASPSVIIGVNDGSGWGPADAKRFVELGLNSERIGVPESGPAGWLTEYLKTSEGNGFRDDTVIVGNTPDQEPLANVNIPEWTATTVREVKEASENGATLLEVGNEMYLKGGQAEPARYAEMFVSLANAVKSAGVTGAKLLFNSFGDYSKPGGEWSQMDSGNGWLHDALAAQPALKEDVGGFSDHPYGKAHEATPEHDGPAGMEEQHAFAVKLGFLNTDYYLTEYGVEETSTPAAQAAAIKASYEEFTSDSYVKGIWYYQTHDDSTGKWGLIEPQETGSSPFVPRPSLEVVSDFALEFG